MLFEELTGYSAPTSSGLTGGSPLPRFVKWNQERSDERDQQCCEMRQCEQDPEMLTEEIKGKIKCNVGTERVGNIVSGIREVHSDTKW